MWNSQLISKLFTQSSKGRRQWNCILKIMKVGSIGIRPCSFKELVQLDHHHYMHQPSSQLSCSQQLPSWWFYYSRQAGSFPQAQIGMKIQEIFELPPPSFPSASYKSPSLWEISLSTTSNNGPQQGNPLAAPMEPFATPSTTMARASKVWLGNGLPLRCNILRGMKNHKLQRRTKRTSSHEVHLATYLYYLTYVYSLYLNIWCIYGWITIKLSYSTNFQTPRIKKSNIFPQSPRDSPKVFPRTATCPSADKNTQLIAEESFYPADNRTFPKFSTFQMTIKGLWPPLQCFAGRPICIPQKCFLHTSDGSTVKFWNWLFNVVQVKHGN